MSFFAAVAATALWASQADSVLVTSYQSLGVDAATAARLGEAFRTEASRPPLTALPADASEKTGRAAVMCGEDAACLSTVGQRSGAKYVLAYGIGKVGSSLLVSALFIDVAAGKGITRSSKRVLEATPDWPQVTRELANLVVKPPAEPLVVQVPVVEVRDKPHRFRTAALVSLGLAIAFGIVTTAVGLVAAGNYQKLQAADPGPDRVNLVTLQRGYNFSADTCLVLAVATGLTGLILLILDARQPPPEFETPVAVPPGVSFLRALLLLPLLSSCSLLFDPSKVKCLDSVPLAAGPLDAVSGDGTSLSFDWPAMPFDSGVGGYRLCWGADSKVNAGCRRAGVEACDAGTCVFTLDGPDSGLAYNTRVHVKLIAEDVCGNPAATGPSPEVSTTPLNGSFVDTQGMGLLTACDAGVQADGGLLTFEQQVGVSCISTIGLGDDQWRDATIDVQIRVFNQTFAGVMARVPALDDHAQRTAVVLSASTSAIESTLISQRVPGGFDEAVASSVATVNDGVWRALHVSMLDGGVSVALGDVGQTPQEVLRWNDPIPAAGQLGFALSGILGQTVSAQFKELRVRTRVTLPVGGSTSQAWSFSGAGAFAGVRQVGQAAAAPCPSAFSSACASCAPDPGSQCLQVDGNGAGVFDAPVGIDPALPWHVKLKFGLQLVGVASNPAFLRTTTAPINANDFNAFLGQALLDIKGNLLQPVRVFEQDTDTLTVLQRAQWNAVEMHFDAAHGTYSLTFNGVAHTGAYPAGLGPHLGALMLGGGGELHAFFTDMEIAQD